MAGIEDKEWLKTQIERRVSIKKIATAAGVSRQTVYAWIERHQIPPRRVRPPPKALGLMYDRCRTTKELGELLGVSADTARLWLIDANIDRRRARVDADEVRRKRRAGATVAELATEYGVSYGTIRRRLDPTWGS